MHALTRHDSNGSDFGKGVVGGLLGGLVATWAMGFVMMGAKKLQQRREAAQRRSGESAYQHAWNSAGEETGGAHAADREEGRHAKNGASGEHADAAHEQHADHEEPSEHEEASEHEEDDEGQHDSATVATAKRISRKVFHHELTEKQQDLAGQAVHYGFGSTMGMLYGAAAELAPEVACGGGMPFGAGLWLVADEVAVPALHLGSPPLQTPLLIHGGGLLAHLVYGVVLEGVRNGVRRMW